MIKKREDLLGSLIHDVAHLLRLEIDSRLTDYNLTRVKWLALGILHQKGALTQSDLAQEMELGAASVGRLVDRLVERGFVKREPDPKDRRSYKLKLTHDTVDLLRELDGTGHQLREETLESLTEEEVSSINTGLLKIKSYLKTKTLAVFVIAGFLSSKAQTIAASFIEYSVFI